MKTSCIPLHFIREFVDGTMSQENWIRMAVELGLDGTEICEPFIRHLDTAGKERLSDVVRDAGMQVSQFVIESRLCNPADRKQTVAYIRQSVDEALTFRTNIVRVTPGRGSEGLSRSCADGLKACLDYAEEKGVMLAFEDHFDYRISRSL